MSPRDDKHTIDTPEQLQLQFAVAGIGSRFLAMAVDTVIQIVSGLAAGFFLMLLGFGMDPEQRVWVVGAGVFVFFLLFYGYFAIFEVLWNGQTPGKRVMGIRVVKDSGRPLSVPETIGRNLMRIVDQLPAFYAIGMVCMLVNPRSQRLGDLMAGSLVIREAQEAAALLSWEQPGERTLDGNRISLEDLRLIESFLHRRWDLSEELRTKMAEQILHKVKPEGFEAPGMSTQAVLEQLARERRM